jgi:hypothetical protein
MQTNEEKITRIIKDKKIPWRKQVQFSETESEA